MLPYLLGFLVLLTEAIGGIILLIITAKYNSPYFICIMSISQFSVFFLIAYKVYECKYDKTNKVDNLPILNDTDYFTINDNQNNHNDWKYLSIFLTGIFTGLSSVLFIYSANPARTPIIIQLVLNGLNIIYSFILTKYYLKKDVKYNNLYCYLSIISLFASIAISIIPIDDISFSSAIWPIMFIFSQIFRVLGNITQEKAFMIDNDYSFHNKFHNITYSRLVQFIVVLMFFWLELFIGYESSFEPLKESFRLIKVTDTNFILLEVFVAIAIVFNIVIGWLNSISVNYSTIALTLVSPVVGTFFSLFPQLNNGNHFPFYITIPALALNLLSSYMWQKGEKY